MEREIKRCEKLENALQVMFGGYYKRIQGLKDQFEKTLKEGDKLQIEKDVFQVLQTQE
jgi:hypothetical protein